MAGNPTLSELEQHLAIALHNGDQEDCIATLRQAPLVLPITADMHEGRAPLIWPTFQTADGRVAIIVFTSAELMQEVTEGRAAYGHQTSMAHLACGWPDNTWMLSVNPGTPLNFEFESGYIARLVCPDLQMQQYATPEMPIPVVQQAIRLDQIGALLSSTSNRISGYVQKSIDAGRFGKPDDILTACGIDDHRPYLTDSGSAYFLRWYAVGDELYRVPIGGRDEEQRAASGGWVIEPAPFVGLGMAPHPNSIVAEYRIDAVVLPDQTELGELQADGEYRRRAVFSADHDAWLTVARIDELDEVPDGMREQWAAERDDLRKLIRDHA